MENTQADCTALRPRTVAAIRAEMPEEELLYGLSDFLRLWATRPALTFCGRWKRVAVRKRSGGTA